MKRFRLTSRIGTLTIFAWSKKTAEESAAFDYLMGLGPIFEVVTVEPSEVSIKFPLTHSDSE